MQELHKQGNVAVVVADMVAPRHLPAGVTYRKCNVTESGDVDAAVRGCDAAVHLASVIDMRSSAFHQVRMRNINIVGTHNVINACVANGLAALVYTGSTAARYHGVQPREPRSDVEDEGDQNRIFTSERRAKSFCVARFSRCSVGPFGSSAARSQQVLVRLHEERGGKGRPRIAGGSLCVLERDLFEPLGRLCFAQTGAPGFVPSS